MVIAGPVFCKGEATGDHVVVGGRLRSLFCSKQMFIYLACSLREVILGAWEEGVGC